MAADPLSELQVLESRWVDVLNTLQDVPTLDQRVTPFDGPDTSNDVPRFIAMMSDFSATSSWSIDTLREFFIEETGTDFPWTWHAVLNQSLIQMLNRLRNQFSSAGPNGLLNRDTMYRVSIEFLRGHIDRFRAAPLSVPVVPIEPTPAERSAIDSLLDGGRMEMARLLSRFPNVDQRLGVCQYAIEGLRDRLIRLRDERDEFVGEAPVATVAELMDFVHWLPSWQAEIGEIVGDEESILELVEETLFQRFEKIGIETPEGLDAPDLLEYARARIPGVINRRKFLILERIRILLHARRDSLEVIQEIARLDFSMVQQYVDLISWMVDYSVDGDQVVLDLELVDTLRASWTQRLPSVPVHLDQLPDIRVDLFAVRWELMHVLDDDDIPLGTKLALVHAFKAIAEEWVFVFEGLQPSWQMEFHEALPILQAQHIELVGLFRDLRVLSELEVANPSSFVPTTDSLIL